ncbi:unnamed protein product [Phytophthora fragariaefolia]|uniref:Unnamed protein product n=1 Tax=Phytophthora fragariaefolia TaxID=1490495 RepID=A0A9W7CYG0_9STRA|nr:unnamed protein product [Phytophthora fragariaefolia]
MAQLPQLRVRLLRPLPLLDGRTNAQHRIVNEDKAVRNPGSSPNSAWNPYEDSSLTDRTGAAKLALFADLGLDVSFADRAGTADVVLLFNLDLDLPFAERARGLLRVVGVDLAK